MGDKGATLILLLILCSLMVALPNIKTVRAAEDSWETKEPMPTARSGLGVAVVDGKIYAIGGKTLGHYLAVNEKYTPIGYIPEFPSWLILPLLITATLVVIICKRRLPKTLNK